MLPEAGEDIAEKLGVSAATIYRLLGAGVTSLARTKAAPPDGPCAERL